MKGYIYEYRNTVNNKYYVGRTIHPQIRYKEHKDAKGNSLFHRAIRKYGFDKFEYTIVDEYEVSDVYELNDILNDAEIKQIDYRDSYNNGYNMTRGGDGMAGYKHTSEAIENNKLSNQIRHLLMFGFIPNLTKGKDNYMYGKHRSKETRDKISLKAKLRYGENSHMYGKHHSEQTLQKLRKPKSEQAKQNMRHSHNMTKKHWKLVDGKRVWY